MIADGDRPHGRLFMIAAFVVAAILGVAVAYLGVTGQIGGPIP